MKHIDHNNDGFIDYREFSTNFSTLQINGNDPALSGQDWEQEIVARAVRGNRQRTNRTNRLLYSLDPQHSRSGRTKHKPNMLQKLEMAAKKMKRKVSAGAAAGAAGAAMSNDHNGQVVHAKHVHINDLYSIGKFVLTSSGGGAGGGGGGGAGGGSSLNFSNDNLVKTTTAGSRPSIAPRGVLLERGSGRWYYEVTVVTPGNAYVGFGDALYTGNSQLAKGIGDDEGHSWGYSGYLCKKKHAKTSTPFGFAWSSGDVVGCLVDMNSGDIVFSLNGNSDKPLGRAYSNVLAPHGGQCVGGMTPIISFDAAFTFRVNLGTLPFRYSPPGVVAFGPRKTSNNTRSVHRWLVTKMEHMYANAAGGQYGKLVSTSGDGALDKLALNDMRVRAAQMSADVRGPGGHVFPSCIVAGVMVVSGKWYFEIDVVSEGLGQLGWCDLDFSGFNNEGVGIGDDKSSWGTLLSFAVVL